MDYVSIDFETANEKRTSACSLGLAVFDNGRIVEQRSWVLNPRPYYFNPFNVMINGITESAVRDRPVFSEVWSEIRPFLQNNLVVSHNTSFDISVLRRTLEYFNLPLPTINTLCTYRLAKVALPSLPSYNLSTVCGYLDIKLSHHEALSDAIACGHVLNKICEGMPLKAMLNKYSFYVGSSYIDSDGECVDYYPCGCKLIESKSNNKSTAVSEDKITPCADENLLDDDFLNKNFVFTGTLSSMQRDKAHEIVIRGGGNAKSGVTKDTDFLVCGIQDFNLMFSGKNTSSKIEKAKDLISKGGKIKLINEDDFIRMIDDRLYEACMSVK